MVVTACERADDPGVATVDPNVVIVQNLMKAYNARCRRDARIFSR
ncbi:MAG: hypothetical protein R3C40_03255 [Parvularculaceae bacterium]